MDIKTFGRKQADHLFVQGEDSLNSSLFVPFPFVKGLDSCQELLTSFLKGRDGFQIPSGEELTLFLGDLE